MAEGLSESSWAIFSEREKYSEKELFLLVHLAYYEYLHGVPLEGEAVVYLNPHSNGPMWDSILTWLEQVGFEIIILEMIRTPFKRLGSGIKLEYFNKFLNPCQILRLLHIMSGETLYEKELGHISL